MLGFEPALKQFSFFGIKKSVSEVEGVRVCVCVRVCVREGMCVSVRVNRLKKYRLLIL